jgi:pyrroloquinoline quinone biosynthesis protein E
MNTIDRVVILPMPAPDRAFYDAVLAAGFARFPERQVNYERYKAATRGERVDYLPIKLDIENVSRCNYRCTMCQVSDWPKMTRAGDMSLADFKQITDSQVGLIEIKLQGMGEPLLAARPFFDMVRYARSRDLWVRSTTNGSLLHLKENYKHLVDTDICEIQVSIDGATAPTYEAIRRGGKFKRVAANCEKLNSYARDAGRHRTRMWVVVQKTNFHEMGLFPELAARLGFSRLSLSLDLNDWGQDRWRASNDQADMQRSFDPAYARDLVERGRSLGVDVTFWFIDQKYDPRDKTKLCPWPFERAYISSDMRVVPCCMVANPAIADLGDARDLTAVWTGSAMREFRRAHLEGRIPDFCRSCYASRE